MRKGIRANANGMANANMQMCNMTVIVNTIVIATANASVIGNEM